MKQEETKPNDNWPVDFHIRLVNAIRLKEFAIEYGCDVPENVVEALNMLVERSRGIEIALNNEEYPDVDYPTAVDVTTLDRAIVALNSVSCPTTLSILSRPKDSDLLSYFRGSMPRELSDEQKRRKEERFLWIMVLVVFIDICSFAGMSWAAVFVIGLLEVAGLATYGRATIAQFWVEFRHQVRRRQNLRRPHVE